MSNQINKIKKSNGCFAVIAHIYRARVNCVVSNHANDVKRLLNSYV